MELEDVRLIADGLAFPEGPVALSDGSVIVVEVNGGRITRIAADGSRSTVAEVGGGPNGAAIGPDGALYVCNNGGLGEKHTMGGCIQRVDIDTGEFATLYDECKGRPLNSPNDLVFDSTGGLWFTDFMASRIFYAAPDGSSITSAIPDAIHCNGIGLSPDESVVYWAQTTTRQVMRRRIESPGRIVAGPGCSSRVMTFAGRVDRWTLMVGLPGCEELDSLAVDSSGAVCVATLVDSGITVVTPHDDGTCDSVKYTLPSRFEDPSVTNICFGGPDLRTAYITLSHTGRLVSCRWPRPGLALAFNR
ncbi:MAG: SMP-30/gluconolactonase/LRE family protein [Acidimicrobiia bacterium]